MRKTGLYLMILVLLGWNVFLSLEVAQLKEKSGNTQTTQIIENKVTQFTTDVTAVVEETLEKVVGISSFRQGTQFSSGSGAIYKTSGNDVMIITNNHVITNADKIEVIFANGRVFTGELMGSDLFTDLALIKVTVDFPVKSFKFGDSAVSKVGEWVLAIGSPLGQEFQGSVTMGILSGKDRVVPVDLSGNGINDWDMIVLQTDAAINPGNSGGPLVNLAGELIGINSMKIASDVVEGMGFSIPINEVVPIMEQLEEFGRVIRPVLGVSAVGISDLSIFQKNVYGIPLTQTNGLYVTSIITGGPAAVAGVKEGDIILEFDQIQVENFKQFRKMLYSKSVNDMVKILVLRNNEQLSMSVRLQ